MAIRQVVRGKASGRNAPLLPLLLALRDELTLAGDADVKRCPTDRPVPPAFTGHSFFEREYCRSFDMLRSNISYLVGFPYSNITGAEQARTDLPSRSEQAGAGACKYPTSTMRNSAPRRRGRNRGVSRMPEMMSRLNHAVRRVARLLSPRDAHTARSRRHLPRRRWRYWLARRRVSSAP